MTFDGACKKEAIIFQDILNLLDESGLAKEIIMSLEEQSSSESAMIPLLQFQPTQPTQVIQAMLETLSSIQYYSRVYPYMNAHTLVDKLFEAFSILSEKCHCARHQLNRKIATMKNNAELLATLEILKDEFGECLKYVNIRYYRIRALKNMYERSSRERRA